MNDLDLLRGTWVPVSYACDGREGPPRRPLMVLTIRSEGFSVDSGDYRWAGGIIRIDPGMPHKEIDFIYSWQGKALGNVSLAIYRLGKDELTLCMATSNGRPTEFRTTAGDGQWLCVYQRQGESKPVV